MRGCATGQNRVRRANAGQISQPSAREANRFQGFSTVIRGFRAQRALFVKFYSLSCTASRRS